MDFYFEILFAALILNVGVLSRKRKRKQNAGNSLVESKTKKKSFFKPLANIFHRCVNFCRKQTNKKV